MKILEHSTLLRKQYPASVKQCAAPGLTHLILSLSLPVWWFQYVSLPFKPTLTQSLSIAMSQ